MRKNKVNKFQTAVKIPKPKIYKEKILAQKKGDREKCDKFFKSIIHTKEYLTTFYNYFNIFLKILDEFKIEYWGYGGTQLGCNRHNGVIPWDDDIDIMVPEKYEPLLRSEKVLKKLAGYGIYANKYSMNAFKGWIQFYLENKKLSKIYGYGHSIPIDAFIAREDPKQPGALNYKCLKFYNGFYQRYMEKTDIYPLKKYKFGPMQIYGMKNPFPYFDRCRWGDYMNKGIVTLHKHKSDEAKKYFLNTKEELRRVGLYPFKDKKYLNYEFPHNIILKDIDYYKITKEEEKKGYYDFLKEKKK